jgi:hypothetical protein
MAKKSILPFFPSPPYAPVASKMGKRNQIVFAL